MSSILNATCVGGVVSSEGVPVVEAEILSKGVGASTGALLLHEDRAIYVTSNAADLETALTQIASALGQVATALTAISTSVCPPGSPLSNAAAVASAATAVTTAQAALTTLKGVLK